MASFKLIRELLSAERDQGAKRILIALYSASDNDDLDSGRRYIALSEQHRDKSDPSAEWVSSRKGITVRKSEVAAVITALQSADFEAGPDKSKLSAEAYALTLDWG